MIYPKRYELEPHKRKAYCEACDLIAVYGVPRKKWNYKIHNISRSEMTAIWSTAETDMNGRSGIDKIYTGKKQRERRTVR